MSRDDNSFWALLGVIVRYYTNLESKVYSAFVKKINLMIWDFSRLHGNVYMYSFLPGRLA